MLLTAQRVRSLPENETAIHVFFSLHATRLPRLPDGRLDARSAQALEGKLIRQRVRLRVGGNAVDSYLDVIADDNTEIERLDEAVREAIAASPPEHSHVDYTTTSGTVSVTGYVSPRLAQSGSGFGEELIALWTAARALPGEPLDRAPLLVIAEDAADRTTFYLDDESAQRVRDVLGASWARPRLAVDHNTRTAFETTVGNFYEQIVPIVTGLELSAIQELGGVRVIGLGKSDVRYELSTQPAG